MHIIAQYMSCVVNAKIGDSAEPSEFDQAVEQGYSEIYIVGADGITKYHKLRGDNRFITVKVDSIPGVQMYQIEQSIDRFLPAGKVPRALYEQIEAFFRKVMEIKQSALEAMIWVLYSKEKGYHLFVPNQIISKAAVKYDWDEVPSGSNIIVDVHSH